MSISPAAAEPLFYCAYLGQEADKAILAGDEARHAHLSRRLAAGDRLWLFDGRGTLARARFVRIKDRGREVEAAIEERLTVPPPEAARHLACALPKGDRQAVLLDMATQLGMTAFTPLVCARSVVRPGVNALARWHRICLEACKQSRRLHLPEIREPLTPAQVAVHAAREGHAIWIAHPGGVHAGAQSAEPGSVALLIGPEGGFTDEEVREVMKQGARAVNLGEAILRIETAAVALLAALALLRPITIR